MKRIYSRAQIDRERERERESQELKYKEYDSIKYNYKFVCTSLELSCLSNLCIIYCFT